MHPRYGWVGVTRRAAAREAIAACADAWLRDWCLQQETLAIGIDEIDCSDWSAREEVSKTLQSARGSLLLAVDEQQVGRFGLRLAAIASSAADAMARELANRALADLLSCIAELAGLTQDARTEAAARPWPEALTRPEWGAVTFRISIAEVNLLVAMDRAAVNGIVPEKTKTAALDGRFRSLQASDVSVTAVLDFGEISVRDLAGLHAGEVLVSERKVGELAELRIGNTRVAGAAIRSIGNRLAVVATVASESKENP